MSLFLRFLACALIVAATSVLAAFAWDHSDAAGLPQPVDGTPDTLRTESQSPASR